eukprot:scaffold119306_cov27-Phaeocystis_antarctica.AAC.1
MGPYRRARGTKSAASPPPPRPHSQPLSDLAGVEGRMEGTPGRTILSEVKTCAHYLRPNA